MSGNSFLLISKRLISLALICSLAFGTNISYAQNAFVSTLPEPGKMVSVSEPFTPILVKGLVVHPDQPLNFDFIVDSGNDSVDQPVVKEQSEKIVRYFLAALTVPEDQLWVNLSPYEKDRIIADDLGQTVLGRDMLAQDYVLKQLTASLIYPEERLGKDFWDRIYKEAREKFGTTDIPVDTFNKVWIVPEKAEVFEKGNAVYVTGAKLKVMLESDYLAAEKSGRREPGAENDLAQQSDTAAGTSTNSQSLSKQLIREIVLPAIEREVNTGKNFATLRHVYYAAILAKWYRELIQDTLMAKAYVGKNKISGVTTDDKTLKEEIYQRYIAAYKKGVFNYIKEETDAVTGEAAPRKYFSGGISNFAMKNVPLERTSNPALIQADAGKIFDLSFTLNTTVGTPVLPSAVSFPATTTPDVSSVFYVDPLPLALTADAAMVDRTAQSVSGSFHMTKFFAYSTLVVGLAAVIAGNSVLLLYLIGRGEGDPSFITTGLAILDLGVEAGLGFGIVGSFRGMKKAYLEHVVDGLYRDRRFGEIIDIISDAETDSSVRQYATNTLIQTSKDLRQTAGLVLALDMPIRQIQYGDIPTRQGKLGPFPLVEVRKAAAEALDSIGWTPQTMDEWVAYHRAKQNWNVLATVSPVGLDAMAAVLIDFDTRQTGDIDWEQYNAISDVLHQAGDPRGDDHWVYDPDATVEGVGNDYGADIPAPRWNYTKRSDAIGKGAGSDAAMFEAPSVRDVGGIDIKDIGLEKKKSGNKIQLNDQAMKAILDGRFDGFTPVFVQMIPLDNPLTVLGVN